MYNVHAESLNYTLKSEPLCDASGVGPHGGLHDIDPGGRAAFGWWWPAVFLTRLDVE